MKFFQKFLIALVFLGGFGACKRDTVGELVPIDQIPAQNAFQNMQDVVLGMNGAYATYQARRSHHVNSYISDEVRLGIGAEYRNVGNILFQWIFVSDSQDWRDTEAGGGWTNLYFTIDRANRLLELMVPVPAPTPAEQALKAQIRGEMLALRAFCHLELLRWYSMTPQYTPNAIGVVLQTRYVRAPGSHFPARNTQQEVVNQINLDLAEARNLIPTTFTDNGRMTRNAVIAIQARLAQHTRDWQGTIDRSTEVITAQPITPLANYAALWSTRSLTSNQSTEVIWKYNINLANIGFAVGSLWQDVGTAQVQASAAVKLTDLFNQTTDVRFPAFFRAATNPAGQPRFLINKYGSVVGGNGENFLYDIKVLRTSEFLLARAEAFAELNNIASANADLAALRAQRITGYTHSVISDRATLIQAIMDERYRELCFEGQRFFDLKRRNLPIQRDVRDLQGLTGIQTMLPSASTYLLPIPIGETQANRNMQQNPGF